jgi:hypothetical protein
LDLLGFIRPIRDLSMGYGEKNKKIPASLPFAAGDPARRGFDPSIGIDSIGSVFRKAIFEESGNQVPGARRLRAAWKRSAYLRRA